MGSDDEAAELLDDQNMWATEYHGSYGGACCDDRRKPTGDEASSGEQLFMYPRLVQRDGTTPVALTDSKRGRGYCCASFSVMFHTMVNWDVSKLIACFFITYCCAFTFFGVLLCIQNSLTDDFEGINNNLISAMAFAAFTMSTIGYGDQFPKNEFGSLIPVVAALCGILLGCFFTGLILCRLNNPRNLSHTVLFSNRAVITHLENAVHALPASGGSARLPSPRRLAHRTFECRMINLRNGLPWVDPKITMYYVSFANAGRPVFTNMPLQNDDVPPFMDLPWHIAHEINPRSPLHSLSLEELAAERGEIVVELEGYDPLTGNGLKKRFSYIASEMFLDNSFYDVLSLDSDGKFVVALTDFHRTKLASSSREASHLNSTSIGMHAVPVIGMPSDPLERAEPIKANINQLAAMKTN